MLSRYINDRNSSSFIDITWASKADDADMEAGSLKGREIDGILRSTGNEAAVKGAKRCSPDYVKVSISIEQRQKRSGCFGSFNNHNLCIDWANLDKKEFMKTVGNLNISDLFAEVVSDRVKFSDGSKKWQMTEYVLQRKDRRVFVGGQGFVLFVRRSQHSSSLAMKVCLHNSCKARIERYQAKADLQIAAQSESRYISDLLVYYMTDKFFVSVMYKAKHSSLKVIKREIGCFPAKFIKYYAVCIADALLRLHRTNICHKDVKADNVLIDHRGVPQLADFGLAVETSKGKDSYVANKRVTTMQYYPPECLVLGGQVNDFKVDTWLFGFFMCELCISSNTHMWTKFQQSTKAGWRFRVCDTCYLPRDDSLGKLLRNALRQDPALRPLLRDLFHCPYFDQAAKDLLLLETAPDTVHIGRLLADRAAGGQK